MYLTRTLKNNYLLYALIVKSLIYYIHLLGGLYIQSRGCATQNKSQPI